MNRIVKVGLAALALAVVSPAFAQEAEVDEGPVGWTPFAIGLVSPVQMPWGCANWDVFGLNLGLLYTDAPKVYGLSVDGVAHRNRDDLIGVGVSGLCNYNAKDVYGLRATLGANICRGTTYGVDLGMFGYRKEFWGFDAEFLGSMQDTMYGIQMGLLANVSRDMSYGWSIVGGVNIAEKAYGCQSAIVFNMAQELHGAQIGLVNFAEQCPWGFQIGLVNIIMDNTIKVLPIVNGYF
jgi:hypothetical protein